MPLKEGTRLGPYEVLAPIGAGGMGEVYRARDTRLDRTVAIKVLPAGMAASEKRRQRLEREARTISQLTHPHICALYDVGHQDGIDFLVMEYLEGETLGDRICRKGPLPIDQVVDYAVQIASALDKAHRHGVTHRDLKPGNIMLTATGAKLLDFGLAKMDVGGFDSAGLLSAAPTEEKPLTAEGALLGTFRYMAPEQLEGKDADARADLWALGLVIREMATGASVFQGSSQASLIAAIMGQEPTRLAKLRPETPPPLDRLVARCLMKDPDERWQSARDLLHELQWIRESGDGRAGAGTDAGAPAVARPSTRAFLWIIPTVVAVLLAIALVRAVFLVERTEAPARAVRFSLTLPPSAEANSVRVSPDGRFLSFRADSNGQPHLWLRRVGSLEARPLSGTEGAQFWIHFWSPDSRYIGFFAGGKLKKIDITGGRPQVLADAPGGGPFQLGTWSSEGTILYNINEAPGHDGLYTVPADGGAAQKLTLHDEEGNEVDGEFPEFLPGGRHFLFVGDGRVMLGSLDTLRAHGLLDVDSYVRYVPPGYLMYVMEGTLMARPFDADSLRFTGQPVRIAEKIETHAGLGGPNFSASRDVLTYYSGVHRPSRLVWRDRNGLELGQVGDLAQYGGLRLSPDEKRLLVSIGDEERGTRDMWLVELGRDVATRFTSGEPAVYGPVWSPDGTRMVFSIPLDAPPTLHIRSLTGGGGNEPLLPSTGMMQWASSWSPDGRLVFYSNRGPDSGWDLWAVPVDEDREAFPFLVTQNSEFDAQLSPDGRWVAFCSDESGDYEIYVVPFDGQGEKRRISTDGGRAPRWRGDGRELFYVGDDNRLIAVPVTLEGGFEPGIPRALFSIEPGDDSPSAYDVTSDGQRFITNSATAGIEPAPTVVLNWTAGLPRSRVRMR